MAPTESQLAKKEFEKTLKEYGLDGYVDKGICKGHCRRCKANRMTRGRNHPNWEIMFWQSIYSSGEFERSHRFQDRGQQLEDITQFEMGLNNRKFRKKYRI